MKDGHCLNMTTRCHPLFHFKTDYSVAHVYDTLNIVA